MHADRVLIAPATFLDADDRKSRLAGPAQSLVPYCAQHGVEVVGAAAAAGQSWMMDQGPAPSRRGHPGIQTPQAAARRRWG